MTEQLATDLSASIKNFLVGYFSTCRRSAKTKAAYTIDLAQFETHVGADVQLADVTAEIIERWAEHLKAAEYAVGSIRRKFATLKVFFGYWVRKGQIMASPLLRIRLDLGRGVQLPRSLASEDAGKLLRQAWSDIGTGSAEENDAQPAKASDPAFRMLRNAAALEILLATGIRVGELVSLTLEDWHPDDESFIVRGKGGRQRLAIVTGGRSIKLVRDYFERRSKIELGHTNLLVNARGAALGTQGVARILTNFAKASGFAGKLTPHMMRHTVATLLLRSGADIRVVQEVLGHTSIAMTQRYTHVSKEHMRKVLATHLPFGSSTGHDVRSSSGGPTKDA